jgi:hypothetical protein
MNTNRIAQAISSNPNVKVIYKDGSTKSGPVAYAGGDMLAISRRAKRFAPTWRESINTDDVAKIIVTFPLNQLFGQQTEKFILE